MFLKLNYFFFLLAFISCKARKNESHLSNHLNKIKDVRFKLDLKKCLPKDTIVNNKISVNYIIQDTSFNVKVQINGTDTLLGFGFDCSAPPGLIPKLYAANENTICFFHGYGQHFREFIICQLNEKLIHIKRYEVALAFDKQNNNVAFQNYDSPDSINIENIKTKKIKTILLPNDLKYKRIFSATLAKQRLNLKFEDRKTVSFLIGKN